jgi:hypothetical protein
LESALTLYLQVSKETCKLMLHGSVSTEAGTEMALEKANIVQRAKESYRLHLKDGSYCTLSYPDVHASIQYTRGGYLTGLCCADNYPSVFVHPY